MTQAKSLVNQSATGAVVDPVSPHFSEISLLPIGNAAHPVGHEFPVAANTSPLNPMDTNELAVASDSGESVEQLTPGVLTAKVIPLPAVVESCGKPKNDDMTVSRGAPEATDKTDETDLSVVTNADFLTELFGILKGDAHPMVCSILDDPHSTSGVSWSGNPWFPGTTSTDAADQNWYFSLARFKPDSEGKYRRRKAQFDALAAIMLDDIGTKAAGRERLDALPPTWLIETSPGNFQAGYVFNEPIANERLATALMNAVITAGLCDKGANGPLTRYARLPAALNGKHTPAFGCRLVEWHPERRYRPEEIVTGLQLDLAKRGGTRSKPSPRGGIAFDSTIYVPRQSENPVITTLKERGLYKGGDGSGKHDITCPWVHEHTGGVDNGTAYFAPDETHPVGGFRCLHGHCAERNINTLIENLGVEHSMARNRSVIRAVGGELSRVVDVAERELAATGDYFQRAGMVVRVVNDPATHQTTIKDLSSPALLRALATVAYWERFDKRMGKFQAIDPPPSYVSVLSSAQTYRHLPALHGIARQPYLRPDGSLMSVPGYDEATGMYGVFNADDFVVQDEIEREEAIELLSVLDDLLKEFAFATEADRSAAIAAMLTAAIRPSLPQAPMFHVRAPQISSGKSYLTTLIAAFATPNRTPAASFPKSDEECQKLLLATLVEAPAVVCFDNLVTDLLPHKTRCRTLTDELVNGRLLGYSRTATVGTRVLFLSSGNNVGPIRDMTRRCITITLDPVCETPASRTFSRDPVQEVRNSRGEYVSKALAIIRAWIHAGRPMTKCRSLASYGGWSDLVRQTLLWLGLPDPAESVFANMAVDPDTETLGRLLTVWKRVFGNSPTMVRDIVGKASRHSEDHDRVELHEVISDIADERGEINRRRFGWWIDRHAGRVVDGMRFVQAPKTRNAVQWQVVSVSSVSSVSVSPPATSVAEDPVASIMLD